MIWNTAIIHQVICNQLPFSHNCQCFLHSAQADIALLFSILYSFHLHRLYQVHPATIPLGILHSVLCSAVLPIEAGQQKIRTCDQIAVPGKQSFLCVLMRQPCRDSVMSMLLGQRTLLIMGKGIQALQTGYQSNLIRCEKVCNAFQASVQEQCNIIPNLLPKLLHHHFAHYSVFTAHECSTYARP